MRGRKRFRRRRACRGTPRRPTGRWILHLPNGFRLPIEIWARALHKRDITIPVLLPPEPMKQFSYTVQLSDNSEP